MSHYQPHGPGSRGLGRPARAILGGLALSTLLFAGGSTPLTAAVPICSEGSGKPDLKLVWSGLPKEESTWETSSQVKLLVENHSSQLRFIDLSAAAVLDDRRESLDLGQVIVPAGKRASVVVDLAAFGVNPYGLDFAGRLDAKAVARNDNGPAPVESVAYSPFIFFHPKGARLQVYRRGALLSQHHAGDYADHALKIRSWVADRGLSLMGVGYYDPDLPLSDDDGGPEEERPHTHGRGHGLFLPSQLEITP